MSFYVAAASEDGVFIDSHFGQANLYRILFLDEEKESWELVRTVEIHRPEKVEEPDSQSSRSGGAEGAAGTCGSAAGPGHIAGGCFGHDDSAIQAVAEQLKGCRYVLVRKIGPRPQRVMSRYGISCLETEESIENAMEKLLQYQRRFGSRASGAQNGAT